MDDEWWRVCVGRVCAIGRRYAGEMALETVEEIVDGSSVDPRVLEQVFGPLRKLRAYTD